MKLDTDSECEILGIKKPKLRMTRKEVRRFVLRVLKNKNVKFDVKFFNCKSEWAFGATIQVSPDDKYFLLNINTSLQSDIRRLLLHEIGHLEGVNSHSRSSVEREIDAQLWAIKRAKELKWNRLAKFLKWEMQNRWTCPNYKWNSPYRVYILANRLAKKKGII